MLQLAHNAAMQMRVHWMAPARRRHLDQCCENGQAPSLVAFYHRVADEHPNNWTISNEAFQRQINHMATRFDFVDLAEVQRRVRTGNTHRASISITFDDGYADNNRTALPMLVEQKIPVTYFVSSGHVRSQRAFAHDIAAGVPLAINTAADLRRWSDAGVEIGGHTSEHADLSDTTNLKRLRSQIVDDKDILEQIIGRPLRFFAFPFGLPHQLNSVAIETVLEAGYEGFCSAFGGYNRPGIDAHHIRRFHGDPVFSRLRNWLSYDIQKNANEPRVVYSQVCG